MKDTISLTIPMDYNALTRASDMLHGMAQDLTKEATWNESNSDPIGDLEQHVAETNSETGKPDLVDEIEPSATTVFGGGSGASLGTDSTELTVTDDVPAGVELDSAGLPWDHRIHGAARKKLAKTQTWKYIRNIDPALIDQVEAELRVTMAASPSNPVVTPDDDLEKRANIALEGTGITTPAAPAAPATAPIVETEVTPAPPATDITFPVLMGRITAGKITTETVTAACNKQGIAALPLLAARPDLVPLVAAELGITA